MVIPFNPLGSHSSFFTACTKAYITDYYYYYYYYHHHHHIIITIIIIIITARFCIYLKNLSPPILCC